MPADQFIRINGVMVRLSRRLAPLMVGVMVRQEESPTAKIQALIDQRAASAL